MKIVKIAKEIEKGVLSFSECLIWMLGRRPSGWGTLVSSLLLVFKWSVGLIPAATSALLVVWHKPCMKQIKVDYISSARGPCLEFWMQQLRQKCRKAAKATSPTTPETQSKSIFWWQYNVSADKQHWEGAVERAKPGARQLASGESRRNQDRKLNCKADPEGTKPWQERMKVPRWKPKKKG